MKTMLALLLVLCSLAAPALAEDAAAPLEALLEPFYLDLIADGTIPDAGPLSGLRNVQTDGDAVTIYYDLSEWLMATLSAEEPYANTCQLLISGVYLPDGIDASEIFARFLAAIAPNADAPADIIAWLDANLARTSLYTVAAARNIGDDTTAMRGESLSNAESILTVVQYLDMN